MFNELLNRYPCLENCKEEIAAARDALIACYEADGKVMICGNGGSCADADHIVGELMKGFLSLRPLSEQKKAEMKANTDLVDDELLSKLQGGLPAYSLPSMTALNMAFCNDVDPELIYAQNVFGAVKVAKALGVKVIGLTGGKGGKLKEHADIAITVPESETFKIQELHLPVYHYLCAAVEQHFFGE